MTGSIFEGLEAFGIKNIDSSDMFSNSQTIEDGSGAKGKTSDIPEIKEADFIFDKSYECPVCAKSFKIKAVKANRAKLTGTDRDLRPIYQQLDVIKYDEVVLDER